MAELLSRLKPKKLLEIGCANGPLMKCLFEKGIDVTGVDLSKLAKELAFPEIKEKILTMDILEANFEEKFDLIVGLDIFEHLNPNKIEKYIQKLNDLLKQGGKIFTNIPAVGNDRVFGEIFGYHTDDWKADAKENKIFSKIHTDFLGYPLHGHLIWADTSWWEFIFTKNGFIRDTETEIKLHKEFDEKMDYSIGRKSYYIFVKK